MKASQDCPKHVIRGKARYSVRIVDARVGSRGKTEEIKKPGNQSCSEERAGDIQPAVGRSDDKAKSQSCNVGEEERYRYSEDEPSGGSTRRAGLRLDPGEQSNESCKSQVSVSHEPRPLREGENLPGCRRDGTLEMRSCPWSRRTFGNPGHSHCRDGARWQRCWCRTKRSDLFVGRIGCLHC